MKLFRSYVFTIIMICCFVSGQLRAHQGGGLFIDLNNPQFFTCTSYDFVGAKYDGGFKYQVYEGGLEIDECGFLTVGVEGSYMLFWYNSTYHPFVTLDIIITKEPEGNVVFSKELTKSTEKDAAIRLDYGSFEEAGDYILHIQMRGYSKGEHILTNRNTHMGFVVGDATGKGSVIYEAMLDDVSQIYAMRHGFKNFCGDSINGDLLERHTKLDLDLKRAGSRGSFTNVELNEMVEIALRGVEEHEDYINMALLDSLGDIQEMCDVVLMRYLTIDCGEDKLCLINVLKRFKQFR